MEIEAKEQLKPCPFCGGAALFIEQFRYQHCRSNVGGSRQVSKAYYTVKCCNSDCPYEPTGAEHHAEQKAIEAWNKRTE